MNALCCHVRKMTSGPATPAWLLVNGFTLYLIALHYLNIDASKTTSALYYMLASLGLGLMLLKRKLPQKIIANDLFFFLFIAPLLISIAIEYILHRTLPHYIHLLPFFVVLPYVAGRLFNSFDRKTFLRITVFLSTILIPLVVIDLVFGEHNIHRPTYFGYYHGAILTSSIIALGQVILATYLLLVKNTSARKYNLIACAIALALCSFVLGLSGARGWMLASTITCAACVIFVQSYAARKTIVILIIAIPMVSGAFSGITSSFFMLSGLNALTDLAKNQRLLSEHEGDNGAYFCQEMIENSPHKGSSFIVRLKFWCDSYFILKDTPILGVGAGRFIDHSSYYDPHSTILHAVTELGMVGGIPFMLLMIFSALTFLRGKHYRTKFSHVGLLALFVITLLTDQLYGNYFHAGMFFLLCGIAARIQEERSCQSTHKFPKITVITPSYNQADYLERTICSVLEQNYPNLEYIIVDGGSTDGSVEIIKRYEDRLAWWVSESDDGQSQAINKGLKRATGEWVAWQNSDDIYYPGALHDLAKAADQYPDAEFIIGNMRLIDKNDHAIRDIRYVTPTHQGLLAEGMVIANQAAFWRSSVHADIGFLREDLHYSFDYEWFLRLTKHVKSRHINRIWGALRHHEETKTHTNEEAFAAENQLALSEYHFKPWKKFFYKMRRAYLTALNGNLYYLLRGCFLRIAGRKKELL
jgi:glycosyltransferase involved in cell wall biosynthesis